MYLDAYVSLYVCACVYIFLHIYKYVPIDVYV